MKNLDKKEYKEFKNKEWPIINLSSLEAPEICLIILKCIRFLCMNLTLGNTQTYKQELKVAQCTQIVQNLH